MAEALAADTVAEAEDTPQKAVRRWLLEIKLAEKREKDWRKLAKRVIAVYRGRGSQNNTTRKKNSFNILWANTETLRPALYNSPPKPDVRRRFRQNDMLGKAVGEVMERSLAYCTDAYDLDNCLQNDTLDSLLPGRGLSRVRYVPKLKTVPKAAQSGVVAQAPTGNAPVTTTPQAEGSDEAYGGDREEVEYEQALCEHVQWDDFLHGPGKTWEEVQWVAFRARLSKDDLVEKFGKEISDKIRLDDTDDEDLNNSHNADLQRAFKRAELWEIWDKEGSKVFFLNESYKDGLLYPLAEEGQPSKGEPPLKLKNFFPVPRPLQMVEDTGTLLPEPLYALYEEQALELDRVSGRINKIINACRVRFIYDATMSEVQKITEAGDNDGIPSDSARAYMANGGLDKAIWWMPVEQVALVLKELYVARDSAKMVIYEITGISDILRGATDPNETLGAQQLKANSSSLRLERMKREVQRYARDLIRLLAEVVGENFAPETLAQMTGLQFPTAVMKQQAQLQMQAAKMQGQPVDPNVQNMLQMPTWEDIMGVLKSDMQREYRVDIETDSTVAQSLQQDMEGLKEVLTSVVEFWQGVGPAVQAGAVSMEAVKAITMSVVRRARMGLEVEDALESGMQEPKQQGDPKAAVEAEKLKQQQMEAQHAQQLAEQQAAHDAAIAQRQAAHEEQIAQRQAAHEQAQAKMQATIDENKANQEDAFNRWKVERDNAAKIAVAEIAADAHVSASLAQAEEKANTELATEGGTEKAPKAKRPGAVDRIAAAVHQKIKPALDQHAEGMAYQAEQQQQHGEALAHVIDYLNAPKTAERDATGRLVRLTPKMSTQGPLNRARQIQPDASGRPVTIQ